MFLSIFTEGILILVLSSLGFRSWMKTIGVFKEVFRHEKNRVPHD